MGYEPAEIADLKYTISASPSRWEYSLLPSANIEGAWIIQNLQMTTQPNQTFEVSCNTYNKASGLNILQGYLNSLTNTYVNSGTSNAITAFLIDSSIETGTYSVKVSQKYLGTDNNISSILIGLQSIGSDNNNVPIRATGYNFGY